MEAILREKAALDKKLETKKNYHKRLNKEKDLNQLKQKLDLVKYQIDNLEANPDPDKVNAVLIQQLKQIDYAIGKVEEEIKRYEKRIDDKNLEYSEELKLSKEIEKKKADEEAAKEEKLNVSDLDQQLESYQEKLKNARSASEKDKLKGQISELEQKYPEGVYEEFITESNRTIKKVIVSKAGRVDIYKMIVYNWGGVFYFKNVQNISKAVFDNETKY